MVEEKIWDKIKAKVSISDIYPNILKNNRGDCIFNAPNQKSPSFIYYPENESWFCWQCRKGGDVIELYCHINNCDRKQAIKELAKEYKIPFDSKESKIEIETKIKIEVIFADFMIKCNNNLKNSEYYDFVVKKRGFTEETMNEFFIGLFDDSIREYMEKTYNNEELTIAGFKSKKDYWIIGKRIVYPYLDTNGKPIYFIYRLIDSEPDFNEEAKYVKQKTTDFVQNVLFGYNSFKKFRDKPLIITEGMTDSISVIQAKFPCLSPITIRLKKDDFENAIHICKRYERVIIINDNEENKEGLKGAVDILKFFLENGINAFINEIPNPDNLKKIDLDDYLKKGKTIKTQETLLQNLVDTSFFGFDYLLEQINEKSKQEEIEDILNLIPEEDLVQKSNILKEITVKTNVKRSDLEKIYSLVKEKRREEKSKGIEKKHIKIEEEIEKKERKFETSEISAVVRESEDTIHEVICLPDKILYRKSKTVYNRKTKELEIKNFDTIMVDEPFSLENIYYNQNSEIFYEIQFGEELICLNKKDLLDFIENERNFGNVSGRVLKESISVVLRTSEKVKKLVKKEMYQTLGVFLDKNNELIVVHPENPEIKLYGINDYQKRSIELCKKRGIDINGDLLKIYFDLLNINSYPDNVKLTEFGISLISTFYYVLRNYIDIFPLHFYIVPLASVGKTELQKLVFCDLFGVELKNSDDIDSPARLTENCTDTTFPLSVDDIDKLEQKALNYIKTTATTLKPQERMTKDRKTKFQDAYRSFSGTANSDDFLSGDKNEAMRDRCLISRDFKNAFVKDLKNFENLKEKIVNGKIVGYYVLNKSIEYLDTIETNENLSNFEKLKYIIKQNKEEIRNYVKNKLDFIRNPRRLMIYTLLITSWQMWDYIFQDKGLTCKFLKDILDYKNNNKLYNFIEEYEENTIQISYKEILLILEFYESVKGDSEIIKYENTNNIKVLTSTFITKYDEWARKRGYEILGSLDKLRDILSKFTTQNIKSTIIKTREIGSGKKDACKKNVRGIVFYENKVYRKLGLKEKKQKKIISDNKKSSQYIEYDTLMIRLKRIAEDNNWIPLEKNSVIQRLELDETLDRDYIEKFIDELVEKEILIEKENNFIQLKKALPTN